MIWRRTVVAGAAVLGVVGWMGFATTSVWAQAAAAQERAAVAQEQAAAAQAQAAAAQGASGNGEAARSGAATVQAVQAAATGPGVPQIKFDVVTFKPCEHIALTMKITIMPPDGDFIAKHCQTVGSLISVGYVGRGPFHLSGEPAWVDSDAYDFQAKVAPGDVAAWQKMTLNQKRAMVWAELEDALHMKTHMATETHPIYALVVAKGGPKLTPYKDGEETNLAGGRVFKGRDVTWVGQDVAYYQGTTMGGLADGLSARLDRQVVDKTGLGVAMYDVTLTMPFAHYDAKTASVEETKFSEIFDGVKALGLRLEPDKGESIAIVMDHIERPAVD